MFRVWWLGGTADKRGLIEWPLGCFKSVRGPQRVGSRSRCVQAPTAISRAALASQSPIINPIHIIILDYARAWAEQQRRLACLDRADVVMRPQGQTLASRPITASLKLSIDVISLVLLVSVLGRCSQGALRARPHRRGHRQRQRLAQATAHRLCCPQRAHRHKSPGAASGGGRD